MTNLAFYDAAFPPATEPPNQDGVMFYIGGDTPHVWTKEEVDATTVRFRLPTWVRSDPANANAANDARDARTQLALLGAPTGILVALDSETSVDPNYVASFYYDMRGAGYPVIDYGSISTVFGNHIPDGLYDGAHWTNRPHIEPGTEMTQWEALGAYDESSALPTLPFWDTQKVVVIPMPVLPLLKFGDTGIYVRRLQGLSVANGIVIAIDGDFGPITEGAVKTMQLREKLPESGIVDAPTWRVFLGATQI